VKGWATGVEVPLLVDWQVSPLLQDAHVLARQRPASEGVVWPVFGMLRLLGRGCVALKVCEAIAAAVLALHRGLLVPVVQVGIGLHLSVAVGLDLDALYARALVVVVFALDRHVGHFLGRVVT
jgi:hypothetical protein